MQPQAPASTAQPESACQVRDLSIPELVAEVIVAAPPADRGRLLAQLLRPLGLLSLFAVAGGVFARARLRGSWPELELRPEDIQAVRAVDVAALADYAQQVSVEAVDGLAQLLTGMPSLAGSAAAVLLASLLLQRAGGRGGAAG
jgi:hypothetical protein